MKKTYFISFVLLFVNFWVQGQGQTALVKTVDSLRIVWDKEAVILETYKGMEEYCRNGQYRRNTIELVKVIHHYDSMLYKTVVDKYDASEDEEAKATLKDIEKLEKDYTTKSFLTFIHEECSEFNSIEKNYSKANSKQYKKEVASMEKKLVKYVEQITSQIDIVDEHIHHLENL
ncbi:hypothetical protein BFP72_07195 [Reichenbachiella sp. 5M10]|uniref:hypothetical protein n=1 Tax=Reichenbachiella sp. 5M10 TaxID=1889772 RepID=UPI000C150C70|nr:hypothetical protein [Reichenbachiella sp. 5M10]PIB35195.1 hypothetical protein BFP72_07195 [Reichenbachiella sp. 5M10]